MIDRVEEGVEIDVLFRIPDDENAKTSDEEWFTGTVVKVHSRDEKSVVCHIVYEDGEEETEGVLKEREYYNEWCFVRDDDKTPENQSEGERIVVIDMDEITAILKRTNCILSIIAFAYCTNLCLPLIREIQFPAFSPEQIVAFHNCKNQFVDYCLEQKIVCLKIINKFLERM